GSYRRLLQGPSQTAAGAAAAGGLRVGRRGRGSGTRPLALASTPGHLGRWQFHATAGHPGPSSGVSAVEPTTARTGVPDDAFGGVDGLCHGGPVGRRRGTVSRQGERRDSVVAFLAGQSACQRCRGGRSALLLVFPVCVITRAWRRCG